MPIQVPVEFTCLKCGKTTEIGIYDNPKQTVHCPHCNHPERIRFPGSKTPIQIWGSWIKPLILTLVALSLFFGITSYIIYQEVNKIDVDAITTQILERLRTEVQKEMENLPTYLENNDTIPRLLDQVEVRIKSELQEMLSNEAFIRDVVGKLKTEIMAEFSRIAQQQGFSFNE